MSNVLKIILINALIFISLFGLIEICLRITNPSIQPLTTDRRLIKENVYGPSNGIKPEVQARSMGHMYHAGDNGFWQYDINPDTSDNWLFLGDSVTMGMGVDQDSTYAGKLARHLDNVKIINSALIGYSSDDYYNVFNHLVHQQDIPISKVTLFWCLNDVYSLEVAKDGPKGLRNINESLSGFVYNYIYTYQWLKNLVFDRPKTYYIHDQAFYKTDNPNYQNAMHNIDDIHHLTDSLNIPFEVLVMPYEYQFRSLDQSPQKLLIQDLTNRGIPVINVYDVLNKYLKSHKNLYLYGDGIHFSVAGHQLIYEHLKEMAD